MAGTKINITNIIRKFMTMNQAINLPSLESKNFEDKNLSELLEFSYALAEKIKLSEELQRGYFIQILKNLVRDLEKYICYYENGSMSFHDAYEEISSLYVFSEIYLPLNLSQD